MSEVLPRRRVLRWLVFGSAIAALPAAKRLDPLKPPRTQIGFGSSTFGSKPFGSG